MVRWLKSVWCKYNPFDIDEVIDHLIDGFKEVNAKLDRVGQKLDEERAILEAELSLYKSILHTIGDTIPDMMWMKDLSGKYMYANPAIQLGLLFCTNPIGKTDAQLASAAKMRFGDNNHTFGEKCANSDKVVIELASNGEFTKEDGRFLESGKILGKMVYLEVYKAPVYIDDKLVGVCGTGRDISVYVEAYRANKCSVRCPEAQDIFKRYEFQGEE
jgi:hypothetical protein